MSVDTAPNESDIFHIHQDSGTMPDFPTVVAQRFSEGFISGHENLSHQEYATGIVGSAELTAFYDNVNRSVRAYGEVGNEPIALQAYDGSLIIGHGLARPRNQSPSLLHVDTYPGMNFGLAMCHSDGYQQQSYVWRNSVGDVKIMSPQSIGAVLLEVTTWAPYADNPEVVSVRRKPMIEWILAGRTTVESHPYMQETDVANAYDQMIDPLQMSTKSAK